jgi:hypothetical protein
MQIKKISDYYKALYELYPEVPKKDIERIMTYGWKLLYLYNIYGGDTLIQDRGIWCYIGRLTKDSVKHFHYYIKKLTIKFRVLYKKKKIPYNGYYYFALSDSQYENFLSQHNKRGRKRKTFQYGNQVLYKILDECRINEYNRRYIFKVPIITDMGFRLYKENFISGEAELVETRDPMKFKDILVNNNEKYEYLKT